MSVAAGRSALRRLHVTALAVSFAIAPMTSRAHAFGDRYELPIPVWLFVVGGALTVTVSFLLLSVFVRTDPRRYAALRYDLGRIRFVQWLVSPLSVCVLRWSVVSLLGVVVLCGFIGSSDPNRNLSPTFVWIVWWIGFSYFAMLIGNAWPLLNPWRTLFDAASRIYRRSRPAKAPTSTDRYPARLESWPAAALLLAVAWIELVFPFRASPLVLSMLILGYSVLTWAGMHRFGMDAWLRNADPFHVTFELYGRFAPVAGGNSEHRGEDGHELFLRPYAADLLGPGEEMVSRSIVAFVMVMLSTVLFDGLLGSVYWLALENSIHSLKPDLSDFGWILVYTAGLVTVWATFLGLFLGSCAITSRLLGGAPTAWILARSFALTLIPIVIGYHFAHTFSLLLVQGQHSLNLLSDPFGFGWDLFGTRDRPTSINLISTKTAWYLAVTSIVAGHVVSVYLAHVRAERLMKDRSAVLKSLVPLTVLMVMFTMISLSILAEPLVKYSGPTQEIVQAPSHRIPVRSLSGPHRADGGQLWTPSILSAHRLRTPRVLQVLDFPQPAADVFARLTDAGLLGVQI